MMIYQISLVVLMVSFLVLVYLFIKKAPQLIKLEDVSIKRKENFFLRIKKKLTEISFVKNFSWNTIFQKMLSRIRIIILKIENKIGDLLHFLRKKSEKKK